MPPTDSCCDSTCPPLPDGFVRLRYFFGKRLGVADLRDEQAYHRGKIRFHNRHLHGHGVVCGLGLSLFGDDDTGTVLRVGRGAALDTCGREIVVPWDQCIDLSAWLRARQEEAARTGEPFPPPSPFRICVALRHRECPTTPEAAPRDPCACDTGGCEYGRVQEDFELTILSAEDAAPYETPHPLGGPGLPCIEGRTPDWIQLGCLWLTVDADGELTPLPPEDEWSGPPTILRSTAWLQEQAADGLEALRVETDDGTTLALHFRRPPAAPSVQEGAFTLHQLDETGWVSTLFSVALDAGVVRITPSDGFLVDGGRYRLTTVDGATPLVDDALRPLRVRRSFVLTEHDGTLTPTVTSTT